MRTFHRENGSLNPSSFRNSPDNLTRTWGKFSALIIKRAITLNETNSFRNQNPKSPGKTTRNPGRGFSIARQHQFPPKQSHSTIHAIAIPD
ncbi:hypothetical protein CDAR_264171 [Caerostris darwini]|uniref:Ribosomal protein L2 n=1 Tax=Caerostris darwini TaxID=1538125 RepID=A0AAV4X567_9ARAC|nr:hypothetical protein CDAR_264171 [Caerostris darwini]